MVSRRAWLLSPAALLPPAWFGGCAGAARPAVETATAGLVSWRDAAERPLDPAAMLARLRGADWLLLGEVHDNPAHHRVRAELLDALLADGRPTRVVFEQIDRGHDADLAAATTAFRASLEPAGPRAAATGGARLAAAVDAVVAAGRLDRRGWGWPLHRPLFTAALAGGADIAGGNLSRADAGRIVRGGPAELPAELRRWFDPARPETGWSAAQRARAQREVDDGHCHALPPSLLAPMALAQRARDAALADAMLQPLPAPPAGSHAGRRTVLIAGNGHVRSDTGVPHYLRSAGIARSDLVAVGLLERASPTDERSPAGEAGDYDVRGFTEPVARDDPCLSFVPVPSTLPPGSGPAGDR